MFSSRYSSKSHCLITFKNCGPIQNISKRFYAPVAKHTKSYGFGVRNVTFPEQNPLMTARLFRHKRGPRPEIIQYTNGLTNIMDQLPEEVDELFSFDENGNIVQVREDPRLVQSDEEWVQKWRDDYLQCVRLNDLDVDVWGMDRVELDAVSFKHTLTKQLVVDYPVIHDVMNGKDRVVRPNWKPEKVIPGFEHLAQEDPRMHWTKNSHSKGSTYVVPPADGYKNGQKYESIQHTSMMKELKSSTATEAEDAPLQSSPTNRVTVFPKPEDTEIYRRTLFSNSVLAGNYLPPRSLAHNEPNIFFRPEEGKHYTLVMFNPDYPFRLTSDPYNMIHWMKVNMKSPQDGDEILSYLPPIPTECAGTFRYAFAIFEQEAPIENIEGLKYLMQKREPKNLTKERFADDLSQMNLGSEYIPEKPENPQPLNDRRSVSMEELQEVLGLKNIWPSGISFFQTDYDHTVTEVCRKHNIAEMFYVPPDYEFMHERRAKTQRQKYLASFDWN